MNGSEFSFRLREAVNRNRSRLILALDYSDVFLRSERRLWKVKKERLLRKALEIVEKTAEHLAAIKINMQLILPLGLFDDLQQIVGKAEEIDLPLIADCKVNDVGHTNLWIAQHIFNAGFDAIIANPFVGWEGGLDTVFEEAKKRGKGVILLVYMSHPAAKEGYGQVVFINGVKKPQYVIFAEKALKWEAHGVIVGATRPTIVKEVKDILGKTVPIFSPGIGVQGGKIEEAFKSGVDYAIVGRTILNSPNPRETAKNLKELINDVLRSLGEE
ncbi:MAG: orotidine 5'-phosphate decarboxylase / HUMPS family protein [Candidatus Baldrarchaeia archaeon]